MIKPNSFRTCDKLLTISKLPTNYTQVRTTIYNKYRHGPTKQSNPTPTKQDYIKWVKEAFSKDGVQMYKNAFKRAYRNRFERFMDCYDDPTSTCIFEHFDNDDSMKQWKVGADSDSFHGFSYGELVRSKDGHALFKGVLDNRKPDDGLTDNSGFVSMIGPSAPRKKMIEIEPKWNWSTFKALEIRFRGDGRCYYMVINVGSYLNDLSYYDNYVYPLYTRGGPYWQTLRIPFDKFIFSVRNMPQDEQNIFPTKRVKFVAISIQDKIDGPFALEIDYIGLRKDPLSILEDVPYETYSFAHIKYRQVTFGSDPPEN